METKTRFDWKAAVQAGAVASASALLLSLVGMVESFGKRDIVAGVLSTGHTLFFLNMVLAGFMATRRPVYEKRLFSVLAGGLAGLVTSAIVAVVILIGSVVGLRVMLINATDSLYGMLTFGLDFAVGIPLLLVVGTLVGLLTAVVFVLPARFRRAVVMAALMVVLTGLLQQLLRVMLEGWGFFGTWFSWIFGIVGGLTVIGAITVAIVVFGLSLLSSYLGPQVRERAQRLPAGRRQALTWGSWALFAALLLLAPRILGTYPSEVLNMVGLFALMGLGLNIVVGFAGLLDLGYVAFFAIGAYAMGVLTSTELGFFEWNFWLALPVAMVVTLLSGIILGVPVLNTRGDYLAIVTLGFGEIIRLLALSNWLAPWVGGAQGIQEIPVIPVGTFLGGATGGLDSPPKLYYIILAGCLLVIFVSVRLKDSRLGRAWMAVREDEDVAQAMGIPLVKTKLMAFATGATFAGLSGAIFATKLGSIYPHSFSLLYSIYVLCLLIVGGMGSVPGVIVGSLLLIGLPELLREFAEYRMLVYGVVLVFMMLTRPEGFLPAKYGRRAKREAQESAS